MTTLCLQNLMGDRWKIGLILTLGGLGLFFLPVSIAEKYEYKDIYLTENRVCKSCRWEIADDYHTRLINRDGERIVVRNKDVLGMDRNPFWRKAIYKSLHGIGLPGPVIVPSAFENGRDFVCKYCD